MNMTFDHGPGREIGRPAEFRTEEDMCEWIARDAGVDVATVRAARAKGRAERRGIVPTGDPNLDRLRAEIERSLDAKSTPPARSASHRLVAAAPDTPAANAARRYLRNSTPKGA